MKYTTEKFPKSKINFTVVLDANDIKKYVDKAISHFAEHVEVKGFRAGKAPKNLVAKEVGENRINEETLNAAIEDSYFKVITESEVEPILNPKIEVVKFIPNQEIEYRAEVFVVPEVKLADYKSIAKDAGEKDRKEVKVEDKEIKDALDWIVNSRAKYNKVERPCQKGNVVVASYELRADGVKVEDGDQKEHPFVLGESKFIPGFEEKVEGMVKGEEKEFSLDVPADFSNSKIAGKKMDFKVKIDDVMQKELPKLDDDFAKSLGNFESLVALEKSITNGLLKEKEEAEKERFRIALLSKIAEKSEMDLPDALIESEIDKMIHELKHDIEHRGMEFDKYLEHIKKKADELRKELREKAVERVKIALVLRQIGKVENVRATDEELAKKIQDIVSKSGIADKKDINPEKLHDYAENAIVNDKVFELLERLAVSN